MQMYKSLITRNSLTEVSRGNCDCGIRGQSLSYGVDGRRVGQIPLATRPKKCIHFMCHTLTHGSLNPN